MKGVAELKIKQNATGSVDSMNLTKNEGKEEGEKEKPVNLLQNKQQKNGLNSTLIVEMNDAKLKQISSVYNKLPGVTHRPIKKFNVKKNPAKRNAS